jgi:hypothetical protein
MITPSVVTTVWIQRYTPQKQKSGHHFTYLEDYNIQRGMNKQSGFNVEQIDKDKYPVNLKQQVDTTKQHKNHFIIKSTSNNKRRLHISQSSPLSS